MEADSFNYGNLIMHFTRIGEVNSFWRFNLGFVKGLYRVFNTLLLVLFISLPSYSLATEFVGEPDSSYGKIHDAPSDRKLIFDFAQVLSEQQLSDIENSLTWFQSKYSTRFKVVLVKSIGNISMQEFTYQLEEKWGIVTRESDCILLVIETFESKSRIEYNDDLNQYIHDNDVEKILEQIDSYYIKNGLYQDGLLEAISKLSILVESKKAKVYDAEFKQGKLEEEQSRGMTLTGIFVVVLLIVVLYLNKKYPGKRTKYRGNPRFGRSGWGNFSSGSGSFGSGGGFGGFGGGSSGGGGASGSW